MTEDKDTKAKATKAKSTAKKPAAKKTATKAEASKPVATKKAAPAKKATPAKAATAKKAAPVKKAATQAKSESKATGSTETRGLKAHNRAVKKSSPAPKRVRKTLSGKTITVRQTGSPIRRQAKQKATLVGLGLDKLGKTSILPDTPATRGMIAKVDHMVEIVTDA